MLVDIGTLELVAAGGRVVGAIGAVVEIVSSAAGGDIVVSGAETDVVLDVAGICDPGDCTAD